MPTYTVSTLQHLEQSPCVIKPEFKWNDWASVFHPRRRSSVAQRPEVTKKVEFDEQDLADPDKAMAAFFLRQGFPKEDKKEPEPEVIHPPSSADSAIAEEDDDGWTSVQKPKKRGMSRSSFSKWK